MNDAPMQMPKRYRKRPVLVEAIQYHPHENCEAVTRFLEKAAPPGCSETYDDAWYVETAEGLMRAEPGDWIVKGIKGECYPCKADVFEATYEEASDG